MTNPCQLCGEPSPIARRDHGLDLCEPCAAGSLAGRLGAIVVDGLQSAVMSLVTICEEFEVQPGVVDVQAPLEELDVRADAPLAVAALLRHILAVL